MGKRGPKPGSGGRPKIEINWEIFEACCKLCATESEICGVLGVDDNTLERRVQEKYSNTFGEVLKSFMDNTKISLRRFQLQLAEKNVAMAIWLGKQYLDQKDKTEVDNNIKAEITEIRRTIVKPKEEKQG